MDRSTKYLLTHLYLQKLSRLRHGKNYPNVLWWEFEHLRAAAEDKFGVLFETKEKDKLFKVYELVTCFIPLWEAVENPEY